MPAETFYCPHCKRQLTKSAQAYVMGEMLTNKKASFIALGSMPDNLTCPGCGGEIDNKKMVVGEYDAPSVSTGDWTASFVVLAGLIALAAYFIWFR